MSYTNLNQSSVYSLTPYQQISSPQNGHYNRSNDLKTNYNARLNGQTHPNSSANVLNGLTRFKSQPNLNSVKESESGLEFKNGASRNIQQRDLSSYDRKLSNQYEADRLVIPSTSRKIDQEFENWEIYQATEPQRTSSRGFESPLHGGLNEESHVRGVHKNVSPNFCTAFSAYMTHPTGIEGSGRNYEGSTDEITPQANQHHRNRDPQTRHQSTFARHQSSIPTSWNGADRKLMEEQSKSRRSDPMYQMLTYSVSLSDREPGSLSKMGVQPHSEEYNPQSNNVYNYPRGTRSDGVQDRGSVKSSGSRGSNATNRNPPRTTTSMSAPYSSSHSMRQPSAPVLPNRMDLKMFSTLQPPPPPPHNLNHHSSSLPSKERESSGESNVTSVSRQKSPKPPGERLHQQMSFNSRPQSPDGSFHKNQNYSHLNGALYPERSNPDETQHVISIGPSTEQQTPKNNPGMLSSDHESYHEKAASNASHSSTHSSYTSQTRKPFVAPLGIEHLVSHLQNIPSVPPISGQPSLQEAVIGERTMGALRGTGGGVAFRRNQQMSQALHSIQHVDKFRTESNSSKSRSSSLQSRTRADSSLHRTSLQNLVIEPTSPMSPDLYGSLQRSPGYQSSLSSKRDSVQSSNGELLKRNDDGSQDIEIFRPSPGESFGFFVYKEAEEYFSQTTGNPLLQNTVNDKEAMEVYGSVFVSRLKDDRFGGVLNVGDEVIKINGQNANEMTLDEIEHTIQNSQHSVILTTMPLLVSIQTTNHHNNHQ